MSAPTRGEIAELLEHFETGSDLRWRAASRLARWALDEALPAVEELTIARDALDHISKVALQTDRVTKRLAWIHARATHALTGTPYLKSDLAVRYPHNRLKELEVNMAALRADNERLRDGTLANDFRLCREELNCQARIIEQLRADKERLRGSLSEISEGKGAFSTDQLTHAANTIRDMKALAVEALQAPPAGQ